MSLSDQRVIIIGGTSGIGLATALLAAREGAAVVVASSNPKNVDAALSILPESSRGDVLDATDSSAVAEFFERQGVFDHLVFSAGGEMSLTPMRALDLEMSRSLFELRYFGAISAVGSAIPFLRRSAVIVSGVADGRPSPGWTIAASICGALRAAVRAMAIELAPVRVNGVASGLVRSPMWSGLPEADREQMYEQMASILPVGRVGEPHDLAKAVVYLLQQEFATGATLTVDGGTLVAFPNAPRLA